MKPKILISDTKKLEQPQDSYPYGKNGIWNANKGALQNEKGFRRSSAAWPYKYNGTIETDTYPVIFTTDNVNSAAGFWDVDKDIYTPIFNDSTLSFKFGFNLSNPIKGEARRNYRNEIELTWLEISDGVRNPPRWINTVRLGNSLNDFLLFPESKTPFIALAMQAGGNLGMGAYFIAAKYVRNDGTETRYTTLSAPLIAVSTNWSTIGGGNTGQALVITITGADDTYDRIALVVVERINGVDIPYELPELNISPTITFIYTGSEKQTQLTMDEVLIPAAFYTNARAITQLSDQLFLGNMDEEETIDWQKYANLVTVRWKSTLVHFRDRDNSSRETSGFMHDEVYQLVMVLKLKNGRNSRGFILSGPNPIAGDESQSTLATSQDMTAAVYQMEDTVRNLNTGTQTGDCGVWLNQDEVYPNVDQFNSTDVGGEDLRGQKVRHFKMPSIGYCKKNLYSGNGDYGRAVLDTLGLEVHNVIIPPILADKVLGWELHYAKRDFNNATILGQSLLLFGAQGVEDTAGDSKITSTGGNWGSYTNFEGHGTDSPWSLKVKANHIRFHAFDLLNLRPSINATHISLQLDLVARFIPGIINRSDANQQIYNLDYTASSVADPTKPVSDDLRIRRVVDGQYVVDGQVSGDYSNTRLEDAYVAKLAVPNTLMNSGQWTWNKRDYNDGSRNGAPLFEQTWLTNLVTLRRNVYVNYYSQTLVRTGYVFSADKQTSDQVIYGGDCFISYYSFNTYGLVTKLDVVDTTGKKDWKTTATDGIKTDHLFICETVGNVDGRFEIPGNSYSKFYPKSTGYLDTFDRNTNPNQIGYIKDTNAVGDLLNGIRIASPLDDFVTRSPYKITRSQKQIATGKINSWKNFNALDFYETVKNKGEITNLQGYADKLIIHHTDGFFVTRDKAVLSTDILAVTLGTGDIFQFEPIEGRPTKLGYAGTNNPFACILTPAGYIFPDTRTGEIFLFNGALDNIGNGVINFLLKYLTVKEINSYIGNGITIGYDQFYKRILLTVKSKRLSSETLVFVPGYTETPEFFATLVPNVSVVYKDGRYELFKGLNSSEFECTPGETPVLPDYDFASDEHVPNGTVLGSIVATGGTAPYNYLITTLDKAGLALNSLTGQLFVQNTDAFDYTRSVLHLNTQATDINGNIATGSIDVTINFVESTPVLPSYARTIPEHTANSTAVVTVLATDRDLKPITYSVISGNGLGAFAIDMTTGAITVVNSSVLEYSTNPLFNLVVRATAGTKYADNNVTIALSYVFQPPTAHNSAFSTLNTTANGTYIGTITAATLDPGDSGDLQYELVTDSTPSGALQVIVDSLDANFLKVKVLDHTLLDVDNNNYVLSMKVFSTTDPSLPSNFTVSVTVVEIAHVRLINTETVPGAPWADTNLEFKIDGVSIIRMTGTDDQTFPVSTGSNFTVEGFSELPSTGDNPQRHFVVTKNGIVVMDEFKSAAPGVANSLYAESVTSDDEYVIQSLSSADAPSGSIPCGTPVSYSGGASFPTENIHSLGSSVGTTVVLHYDALSIPDKYVGYQAGVKVFDTGYRGDISYQTALNTELASRGLPPETIVGPGLGTISFTKTMADSLLVLQVFAPLTGTSWNYTLDCPI